MKITCPDCKGKKKHCGYVGDEYLEEPCPTCDSTGTIPDRHASPPTPTKEEALDALYHLASALSEATEADWANSDEKIIRAYIEAQGEQDERLTQLQQIFDGLSCRQNLPHRVLSQDEVDGLLRKFSEAPPDAKCALFEPQPDCDVIAVLDEIRGAAKLLRHDDRFNIVGRYLHTRVDALENYLMPARVVECPACEEEEELRASRQRCTTLEAREKKVREYVTNLAENYWEINQVGAKNNEEHNRWVELLAILDEAAKRLLKHATKN